MCYHDNYPYCHYSWLDCIYQYADSKPQIDDFGSLTVIEMVTIDTISLQSKSGSTRGAFGGAGKHQVRRRSTRLIRAIGVLISRLALWYRKRRSRLALADLDNRLLRDVGITQHEARAELRKSIYLF